MSGTKKDRILTAARSVFLHFGFRRVSMSDLAEAAGVSRPALYLLFKNKEDIFVGVFLQWVDETVAEIEAVVATAATPDAKIERAFEIWAVRPFAMAMASPEARELLECGLGFAEAASRQGYARFEAAIVPVLAELAERLPTEARIGPERMAHMLASAVRGFKQTAPDADALRRLIGDLTRVMFSSGRSGHP